MRESVFIILTLMAFGPTKLATNQCAAALKTRELVFNPDLSTDKITLPEAPAPDTFFWMFRNGTVQVSNVDYLISGNIVTINFSYLRLVTDTYLIRYHYESTITAKLHVLSDDGKQLTINTYITPIAITVPGKTGELEIRYEGQTPSFNFLDLQWPDIEIIGSGWGASFGAPFTIPAQYVFKIINGVFSICRNGL